MNKKKLRHDLADIGKDILVAFVIVAVVMLGLFAYSGIWPPMVVIESGSMEHPPAPGVIKSYVGVIDTGDMVFVKDVEGTDDVVTYVQGEASGHSTYGAYGDVIVYRPNGLKVRADGSTVVPIIHRLVVWIDINSTRVDPNFNGIDYANYSFDVPSLGLYNTTGYITLSNYGYQEETVNINLSPDNGLMRYYELSGTLPHGGFITMGDNNAPLYDQPFSGSYEPIQPEWIIGKAWGELPWFGLIKLWFTGSDVARVASNSWTGLMFTLLVLILLPLALEYIVPWTRKLVKRDKAPENPKDPEPVGDLGTENEPPRENGPPEIGTAPVDNLPEKIEPDEKITEPELPERP